MLVLIRDNLVRECSKLEAPAERIMRTRYGQY
jgi:hypothetical protein